MLTSNPRLCSTKILTGDLAHTPTLLMRSRCEMRRRNCFSGSAVVAILICQGKGGATKRIQ